MTSLVADLMPFTVHDKWKAANSMTLATRLGVLRVVSSPALPPPLISSIKGLEEPVDDFEESDLAKFIEDLRTGAVKPYMKSMPVPKKQDTVVRKVVAHNLKNNGL